MNICLESLGLWYVPKCNKLVPKLHLKPKFVKKVANVWSSVEFPGING